MKRLAFAYAAELVIIVASLYGQWLFARKYGHDNDIDVQMMLLAPIGYAVIEICRVPLAVSVRAHASTFVRIVALIGVTFASGVTIKSMSQLGEIMFRPRLEDVRQSKAALDLTRAALATIETQVADADDLVSKSRAEADAKEQRAKSDPALLMSVPKPQCHQTKSVNRDGKEVWGQVCTQDPRTKTITDNLARNAAERKAAYEAVAQAVAARNALGPAKVAADAAVRNAADAHAKAVKDSQLHSFTGMVFGIGGAEVTDAQINQFLRIFVFVPAIFVAFASTFIAFTAVTRVPPRLIPFDPEGTDYLLNPIYTSLLNEAIDRVSARHTADATAIGAKA
jgi:hypothetical protein